MATRPITQIERDRLIADEFGVNADYVGELLQQFERDPSSVDDQWRSLFDELLRNGRVVTEAAEAAPEYHNSPGDGLASSSAGVTQATYDWSSKAAAPSSAPAPLLPPSPAGEPGVGRIPIRGPA